MNFLKSILVDEADDANLKYLVIFHLMALSYTLALEKCELLYVGMEVRAFSLEDWNDWSF